MRTFFRHLPIASAVLFVHCLPAQENAIFTSGPGDGHTSGGSAQAITTAGIFTSGAGDGFARNGSFQSITTAGIFTSGTGDGYSRNGVVQLVSTAGIFRSGMGDGYGRNGLAQSVTTAGIFTSGTGDGFARVGLAQAVTTAGIFTSGAGDGYTRVGLAQPVTTSGIFRSGAGDGYARNSGGNVKVWVQGVVLLEGPWNAGAQLMTDALRAAGLVPLTEPYTAFGYANVAGSGGESTTAGTLGLTGACLLYTSDAADE